MSVCGIDFGNLSMLVAHATKGGVDLILNDASMRQTATAVSFQGKQRFMGDAAAALFRTNIKNTISCMKLLIGREYDDPEVQQELSRHFFVHTKLPHGGVGIVVNYNDQQVTVSVEHLLAVLLVKAQSIVSRANGVTIADLALAVPAWFNDNQRKALLHSCEIAGINCLKIVNESTAIALSYGIYKSAKKLFSETEPVHCMFIDFGYSQFTVTVVDFVQEKLQVRSTVVDNKLGGRDFDDVIVEYLAGVFQSKTGIDVRKNAKAVLKLRTAAEKAKQTLSPAGVTEANISVECLAEDQDLNCMLKRDLFEERISGLIQRLKAPIEAALHEAKLTAKDLCDVEIVGGSSRVNIVKRTLGEILQLDASALNYGLKTTMNSDEAVARGCALQCAIVSSRIKIKPFNIIDQLYYPVSVNYEMDKSSSTSSEQSNDQDEEGDDCVGISTSENGLSSVQIYSRGDENPRKPRRLTFRNKTASFTITTAYASNAFMPASQNRHLGTHLVKIGDNYAGSPHDVRVTFNIDKHGCVVICSAQLMEELPLTEEKVAEGKEGETPVESKEPPKKRFKKIDLVVESTYFGLTGNQIKETIETEAQMANSDRIIIETADKRNELESYIYTMRDKLDGELKNHATNSEKIQFKELIGKAEEWLYGDGFDSTKSMYTKKLDDLKNLGAPIEKRLFEETNRKDAIDNLKRQIEVCRSFSNTYEDAYDHITSEEKAQVRSEADKVETWLWDELEKQGNLASYEDPILTVDILNSKRRGLVAATTGIMNKPKPKPVPKEEKKDDSKEADNKESAKEGKEDDNGSKGENDSKSQPEPMDESK